MLFRTTLQGDLTRYIGAFFDTSVGPKTVPESYRQIATTLDRSSNNLLFISDAAAELRAARASGWAVLMCVPASADSIQPMRSSTSSPTSTRSSDELYGVFCAADAMGLVARSRIPRMCIV